MGDLTKKTVEEFGGEGKKCVLCARLFAPPAWCFYDLCNFCFKVWDTQKMNGRRYNNGSLTDDEKKRWYPHTGCAIENLNYFEDEHFKDWLDYARKEPLAWMEGT